MTENSTMDPRKFITGSHIIQIARAIENGDLDTIKKLLRKEESRLSFNDLFGEPAFKPNAKIPKKINSNVQVFTSMLPFSEIFVKMTTFHKICIENYHKNPKCYKEIFELLLELELEQKNPQKNLAELVVYLVDYTILNPKSNHEFLDVMAKYEYKDEHGKNRRIIDKINLNQSVFIPYRPQETSAERTDASDNDVREPSVSSSNSQKLVQLLSPGRITELCRYSKQQEAQRQYKGVTMPLGKFLSSVSEVSGSEKIAAFAEAIMPSKNVVDPNLTQLESRQLA